MQNKPTIEQEIIHFQNSHWSHKKEKSLAINLKIQSPTVLLAHSLAKMLNLYSIVLLATAITAIPLGQRDVTTVLNNLEAIDSETDSLTTSINSWDGSFFGALSIASASNSLGTAIDTANTEAETESQFSSADTQTVLDCRCSEYSVLFTAFAYLHTAGLSS